ncbi:MAG TPA: YggS family pyridoxal phosphate-dependent enzyme [Magnetospirillum sp.]|nr:YggS family pyridoxal phosphate-dependent enzyme [Magnetospirillum sp.]
MALFTALGFTLSDIPHALAAVKQRIAQSAAAAQRGADDVTLVAVSKTHPAEAIRPALDAGHRIFGENRVQEAKGKWPELKDAFPDVELHLIGPLQTNKVREAVALFDMIETVDRPKLARALADEMARSGRQVPCLLQVNTGNEPQKAGLHPDSVDSMLRLCAMEYQLPVVGLMCIPPVDEDPAPHFRMLAEMAARNGLAVLSMGMSGDFDVAVAEGATHVRVGSAIFGARDYG